MVAEGMRQHHPRGHMHLCGQENRGEKGRVTVRQGAAKPVPSQLTVMSTYCVLGQARHCTLTCRLSSLQNCSSPAVWTVGRGSRRGGAGLPPAQLPHNSGGGLCQ